jgi:predicted RNA-binding protein
MGGVLLNIELSKFCVKKGKRQQVDEWLRFLNREMPGVLLTLEDEKMYVEMIFREKDAEDDYLYWFSMQAEGGAAVEDSDSDIDRIHMQYWRECIDESFHAPTLLPAVAMMPEKIRRMMKDYFD